MLVATEAHLRAALLNGGDITVSADLALTAPLEVTVPGTRVRGGRYHVESGPAWLVHTSDTALAGMRLQGGRDTTPTIDHTQRLIHAIGSEGAPLHDITISDCRVRDTRGDAVRLEWVQDSTVERLHARGINYGGVMVLSGTRVDVAACVITDAPLSEGVVNVYGIAFTDGTNTESGRSRDCRAIGNTVSFIDWEGIDTHGGDGIQVVGNTVVACPRGVALVVGNSSRVTVPRRCTVTGNSITATGMRQPQREGVYLGGLPGNGASATITGNRVDGYTRPFQWADYVDRAGTNVADNNHPMVPWSRLDMTGSAFTLNGSYPLEFMVDGDEGRMRGGVVRKAGNNGTLVGKLTSAHAFPSVVTWVAHVKGTNASADDATLTVYPDGEVRLNYPSGTDGYTIPGVATWRTT
jgi:hypothetical protein